MSDIEIEDPDIDIEDPSVIVEEPEVDEDESDEDQEEDPDMVEDPDVEEDLDEDPEEDQDPEVDQNVVLSGVNGDMEEISHIQLGGAGIADLDEDILGDRNKKIVHQDNILHLHPGSQYSTLR